MPRRAATAGAGVPAEPKRRGRPPGSGRKAGDQEAPQPKAAQSSPEAAPPAQVPSQRPRGFGGPGSVDIDALHGDDLKRYARQVGVTQRDVDLLTEERLRTSCRVMVEQQFAALMGEE